MVKRPIDIANDWLETARITLEARKHEQCIYSLEMAVEIALKAVLIGVGVDVPRVHDFRPIAGKYLGGNNRLPQHFVRNLDSYLSDFDILLGLRSAVGYGFETNFESQGLDEISEDLFSRGTDIVEACENAIQRIGKK